MFVFYFTLYFSRCLPCSCFVSGFIYVITAPKNISAMLADPLHAVCYVVFVLCACGVCGQMWLDISGMGSRHIAQQLSSQGYSIKGHTNRLAIFFISLQVYSFSLLFDNIVLNSSFHERDMTLYKLLNRYIPTAAILGGMLAGLISLTADFSGSIVSGSALVIVTSTLTEYQVSHEIVKNERLFKA